MEFVCENRSCPILLDAVWVLWFLYTFPTTLGHLVRSGRLCDPRVYCVILVFGLIILILIYPIAMSSSSYHLMIVTFILNLVTCIWFHIVQLGITETHTKIYNIKLVTQFIKLLAGSYEKYMVTDFDESVVEINRYLKTKIAIPILIKLYIMRICKTFTNRGNRENERHFTVVPL
ncbi:hypothetical protein AGLY_004732 [Aphis glycines]|uniref:Uncharacterized protein n=1 Tax=Aphis glycines TaxID=307491 RepID=A0A6G0TV81_APHGL|nr:hypothetical protein AGLY_004732 [Aphis glycines]